MSASALLIQIIEAIGEYKAEQISLQEIDECYGEGVAAAINDQELSITLDDGIKVFLGDTDRMVEVNTLQEAITIFVGVVTFLEL